MGGGSSSFRGQRSSCIDRSNRKKGSRVATRWSCVLMQHLANQGFFFTQLQRFLVNGFFFCGVNFESVCRACPPAPPIRLLNGGGEARGSQLRGSKRLLSLAGRRRKRRPAKHQRFAVVASSTVWSPKKKKERQRGRGSKPAQPDFGRRSYTVYGKLSLLPTTSFTCTMLQYFFYAGEEECTTNEILILFLFIFVFFVVVTPHLHS